MTTPEYEFNVCRKILKILPKSKLEIVAYDSKDIKIAQQMTVLVNFLKDKYDNA